MTGNAVDQVKIGWFIKSGYVLHGVVHVGANDGYEVPFYKELGLDPIICFEPLEEARQAFLERNGFEAYPYALGSYNGPAELRVAPGDGQGPSFLRELTQNAPDPVRTVTVQMRRFGTWAQAHSIWKRADVLVIDVQGMELAVLEGMGGCLDQFSFLNIECSAEPIYEGGVSADKVIAYLDECGFVQVTPTVEHNDILFIRKDLYVPEPTIPAAISGATIDEYWPGHSMKGLNIGSGQRRFTTTPEVQWCNIDCVSRPPDQVPDYICDVGKDPLRCADRSIDYCVLHQVYEHFGLGEGRGLIRECYRVLKPGGSLIVTVPDMKALARRWLMGGIDDYIYFVNVYGAYQGEEGDRHKWGYQQSSLMEDLWTALSDDKWSQIGPFNWRAIPGADIARDFWILGVECVK